MNSLILEPNNVILDWLKGLIVSIETFRFRMLAIQRQIVDCMNKVDRQLYRVWKFVFRGEHWIS
jgi:hypothetical protein